MAPPYCTDILITPLQNIKYIKNSELVEQASTGSQLLPMSQKSSDTLVVGVIVWTVVLMYVIHKTIVIHGHDDDEVEETQREKEEGREQVM